MKGLSHLPVVGELEQAYRKLQAAPHAVSEAELALWSQWARFDPRLGEQWIAAILKRWRELSPIRLNEALRGQPWPTAAGPLLEQARIYGRQVRDERALFLNWSRLVMSGFPPAEGGQYFVGLRAFAGEAMRKDATDSLKAYTKWGYLGREILWNKAISRTARTTASPEVRRRVLRELLRSRRSMRVTDYIEALGGAVSRRQAELDLSKDSRLQGVGNTRSRIYRLKRR